MNTVNIYTDGACSGNPGPGGWGTVLEYNGITKELSGGEHMTTNNRMELTAVLKGLEELKRPCEVIVTTDSKYVSDAINKGWLANWEKKNFKGKKNPDLWKQLLPYLKQHKIEFKWVRGHSGHWYNERCDELAVIESKKFK